MNKDYTAAHAAFKEWVQADNAWQAALEKAFGNRAGDKRYSYEGHTHPLCADLYAKFHHAREKWEEETKKLQLLSFE